MDLSNKKACMQIGEFSQRQQQEIQWYELSCDWILFLAKSGRILYANQALKSELGWTEPEGKPWQDYWSDQDRAQGNLNWDDFGKKPAKLKLRDQYGDSYRDVSVWSQNVSDEGASCPWIRCLIKPVRTDKTVHMNEMSLAEQKNLLNTVFDSIQDGIAVLDQDLDIQHANWIMRQWHANRLPLEGKKCYQEFRGFDEPCHDCPTIRCLKSGRSEKEEARVDNDGKVHWVELFSYPLIDSVNGQITGAVEFVRDITERKHIEQQLHVEKEQLEKTLMSVGEGVIATNQHGHVIMINPVAEQLTGWPRQEALGTALSQVFPALEKRSQKPAPDPAFQVIELGRSGQSDQEHLLIRRDQKKLYIETNAAPILDDSGQTSGAVLVLRDVTEARRHQQQIEYLSFHDQLTGLYNRRYMEDALMRLNTPRNLPLAVMFLDVNGLKLTNDAFGPEMGDQLLKAVADILHRAVRPDDLIGRVGGDEFMVIMPNTRGKTAAALKEGILSRAARFRLESAVLSLSVGYAIKTQQQVPIAAVKTKADNRMREEKTRHGKIMRNQSIETVLRNINLKYDNEQIHTERVSQYCAIIASALGLSEEETTAVKTAGMLHDLGKIMIPSEVLNKTGRLTDEEFAVIRKHPETGFQMLQSVAEFADLAEAVLDHHEHWDGQGYPRGLSQEKIPLFARIIAVADAFEAMTAQRPYQETRSKQDAILELVRCAGSQFDPKIVKAFVEALAD